MPQTITTDEHGHQVITFSSNELNGIPVGYSYFSSSNDVLMADQTEEQPASNSKLGIKKAEEKAKKEYVNNMTLEQAEKELEWVKDGEYDQDFPRVMTKDLSGDGKGLYLIWLTSRGDNMWDYRVSFDEFKSGLRLAHFKFGGFLGIGVNVQNKQMIIDVQDRYQRSPVIKYIPSGKEMGEELVPAMGNDGVVVYFDPSKKIESIITRLAIQLPDETHNLEAVSTPVYRGVADSNYFTHIAECISLSVRKVLRQAETILDQNRFRTRRPLVTSRKHVSKKTGKYVEHDVPFSCEIECYGKNEQAVGRIAHSLGKEIGFTHDGSLNSGLGYPVELQTPILLGKRGEICIANICKTLRDGGCMIDKTCGLHIHLDGTKLKLREGDILEQKERPSELISLYLFYRLFDDVIVSFLPSTRRNNRYCQMMSLPTAYQDTEIHPYSLEDSFEVMKKIKTLQHFEQYWYKARNYESVIREKCNRYTPSRYYGANFHSLLKDNHFEVRYHSGTLDEEKILSWINLHGKILQKCSTGEIGETLLRNIKEENRDLTVKTEILYNILGMGEEERAYFNKRQKTFEGAKPTDEIMISKDKKESF